MIQEQASHKRKNSAGLHLGEVPWVGILMETESRAVVVRGQGRCYGELFNGYKVSALQEEQSSIDECGDGSTKVWMYLVS
jgi:hypothetical protein